MKKLYYLFITLLIIIPINIFAVENVHYKVKDILIDSTIQNNGDLKIEEIIVVDGSFNGYIRDIKYKTSENIYNGSGVELLDVGIIDYNESDSFNNFDKQKSKLSLDNNINDKKYEVTQIFNGISIKMYNETINSYTAFYLEYIIKDVAILHNDVAEVYYNYIGDSFDDEINHLIVRLNLEHETDGETRVWAHGPLNGNVEILRKGNNCTGFLMEVRKVEANIPVDLRCVFPKSLVLNSTKKDQNNILNNILEEEQKKADQVNRDRIILYINMFINVIYVILLIIFVYYIFKKYDKEYIPKFKDEYYREINEKYSLGSLEYLMNKKISNLSFSASILNMINNKKLKVIDSKDGYGFELIDEEGLNECEKVIIKLLFSKIKNEKKVYLRDIRSYVSSISHSGFDSFLKTFNEWAKNETDIAKEQNFYEKNKSLFCCNIFYFIISLFVIFSNIYVGYIVISIFLFLLLIIILIYTSTISKRTIYGNEEYHKWKAFKKFLLDFGRFEEKDLPEIILWKKYLVYATVLGISEKVIEQMKLALPKLNLTEEEINEYTNFDEIRSINQSIDISYDTAWANKQTVRNRNSTKGGFGNFSSGSGFGGGFSGGSGFGGGGGGGRGF